MSTLQRRRSKEDEALRQLDPSTSFLYKPHTVTFLLLGLFALIYFSQAFNPERRPADPAAADDLQYRNNKTAVWAIILVYLGYSVIQGPDTCMVRPHPAVWRLVHGMMVCYLMFLVFMLFQNLDDARQFLRHLYPELGVELPEKHYGADCSLVTPEGAFNWKVGG